MACKIEEPFGPEYNVEGVGLKGFRRAARKGLSALSHSERQAYGAAVEAAVLKQQRAAFIREATEPTHKPTCASGTWLNDGAAISRAIRNQQSRALLACPSKIRRSRTDEQWREMYAEAMERKREKIAA